MLKARKILALFLYQLVFFSPLAAATGKSLSIPYEKYTLENGLEVILHQDNKVPIVAIDVWYHVGAGDETPGKSGFAHLFEHMLFQGSLHVGEDKHFATLQKLGASQVNGSTNFDRTNYYEVIPSHHLETGLWLESDRMGYFLPMLTQKSLDNQIEVVRNEKRQRTDNVPYGLSNEALFQMLYPKGHPYRGIVIGRHEDLTASSLEDVKDFYKKWYTPKNATLVIAGDIDIPETKKLVSKWFATLEGGPKPIHQKVKTPKVQRDRKVIVDKFAKLRKLSYAWHTPGKFQKGSKELRILAKALTSDTGRLYKSLVHKRQLAQSVSAYQMSNKLSGVFFLSVMLKPDADQALLESLIEKELSKVQKKPLKPKEIKRAITAIESHSIFRLEGLLQRAETLHYYNHYLKDPGYLAKDLKAYQQISSQNIQNAAATYLKRQNRIEVLTVPHPRPPLNIVKKKPSQKGDKS